MASVIDIPAPLVRVATVRATGRRYLVRSEGPGWVECWGEVAALRDSLPCHRPGQRYLVAEVAVATRARETSFLRELAAQGGAPVMTGLAPLRMKPSYYQRRPRRRRAPAPA